MPVFVRILAVGTISAPLAVLGASGDQVYRTRCALCHDSGATQAPRVGQPGDWLRRVEKGRAGLLRSALEGVRDTATLPRAGFPELSDEDLAAAVDHMLSTLSIAIPQSGKNNPALQTAPTTTRVLPRAKVESARVGGITVEAHDGRIVLRGMVDSAQIIRAAEETARGVAVQARQ